MVEFVIEDDAAYRPPLGTLYFCPYSRCTSSHRARLVGVAEDGRAEVIFTDRTVIEVVEFERLEYC